MRDPNRQPICQPEPRVGRNGGRSTDEVRAKVRLHGDLRLALPTREHERASDDVIGLGVHAGARRDHQRKHGQRSHRATLACAALLLGGCREELDSIDTIFYNGDGRKVHCAVGLDDAAGNTVEDVRAALDRAQERGETVELYGHKPGITISIDKLEAIVKEIDARGMPFVLYSDFAKGEGTGPGVALSLDDNAIEAWDGIRPMLRQYGAHLTFFVSRYARLSDAERATLHDFLADGHELQAHGVNHLREPPYVEEHGLKALLDDEVLPSIDVMRADGYPIEAFAYPFGSRTSEIDDAVLEHVAVVRSLAFSWGFPVRDACP